MICGAECWTPVACPEHGDKMAPRGRYPGPGTYACCDAYMKYSVNPRHLWHEHDNVRHYTDPDGWARHERECSLCSPRTQETTTDG